MFGLGRIFKLLAGRHHRQFVKTCRPILAKIHHFSALYEELSAGQLAAKTDEFRRRHQNGESLSSLLPEAFATVQNAAKRLCGKTFDVCGQMMRWQMIHYDEQLMGGIALHSNRIAEMATGEGKTLVATLPLYLNALTGKNCQLVTVNDYLARRDAEWMGHLYEFLGLSIGCIQSGMTLEERRAAYSCDITYGTASEFGFDYLRDNGLAMLKEEQVQRDHYFCIVDEVDSVLIDEARTPLIISGPSSEERAVPFVELQPQVKSLVERQLQICNRWMLEAKTLLDEKPNDERGIRRLFQVWLGMPKHRQLLKMLESAAISKRLEKFQAEMSSELRRDERFRLKEELYFQIEERQNSADLTELGRKTLYPENLDAFVLPDLATTFAEIDREERGSPEEKMAQKQQREEEAQQIGERIHCLSQLLRAHTLFERDQHYIVHDGEIVIVDPNTGRAMAGRRWSEGLHQAIEAKEGLEIQKENKTYATITVQNYFRMYEKLAGMTGTAETEAQEFNDIYRLSVVAIPTHKPCIRRDENDVIYKTRREKYVAVLKDLQECHSRGQPVLVGTTSVEASELLSKMLQHGGIPHTVLNAKFHEAEAHIVARAGERGAITIATNMAGRGTDIQLAEGITVLGGLRVIGTERHESRRIDRQLRGRCSRQGDPGSSKFFVSLEDDLMRLFASRGPVAAILDRTFHEGDMLAHPLLNRSIANAQRKVEQQNYAVRKRLLQYDDVLNRQREVIYGLRNEALRTETPIQLIWELLAEELAELLQTSARTNPMEPLQRATEQLNYLFPLQLEAKDLAAVAEKDRVSFLLEKIQTLYGQKQAIENPESLKQLERMILLRSLDNRWQNHLNDMDDLRRSVNLRSYGQKNPLYEYKTEAFHQFEALLQLLRRDVAFALFRSASSLENFQSLVRRLNQSQNTARLAISDGVSKATDRPLPDISSPPSSSSARRNDSCPCGSGKKYKKCCGRKS